MSKITAFVLCLLPVVIVSNPINGSITINTRIVAGKRPQAKEFPYQATLLHSKSRELECGGTIIANNWVLTAAHCTYPDNNPKATRTPKEMMIGVGISFLKQARSNKYVVPVKRIILVPSARGKDHTKDVHDIALIETTGPLIKELGTQAATLPRLNDDFIGQTAVVSGYGSMDKWVSNHPDKLKSIVVKILDGKRYCNGQHFNPKIHVCASNLKGGDVCDGDSGEPLVIKKGGKNILVSLPANMFGPDQPCGHKDRGTDFIKVSAFLNFIHKYVK